MGASGLPTSLRVAGGPQAPRAARLAVLSALEGQIGDDIAGDVGLLVSELVTNSVRHAEVGDDGAVIIDVRLLADRLRLAVVDGGSDRVPHLVKRRPDEPGGLGLRLVQMLAAAWGVTRDLDGVTRVWAELALGARPADRQAS